MTFLKKLGGAVLKGVAIVGGITPIISAANPQAGRIVDTATGDLTQIAGVIGQIEAAGQALGLDGIHKLIAAGPLVAQAVASSSLMLGKKIDDVPLFKRGCDKMADGMADILNSFHENGVQTDSLT